MGMAEMFAIAVLGWVFGLIVGGAMAYDKGFSAGVNWSNFLSRR